MGYELPFTIADVADLLSIQRLRGGTRDAFPVVCPFCGDARGKCNFCVRKDGEEKNVFHCFHCGASGNMLTLYAELCGLYGNECYKEAYWMIREQLSTWKRPARSHSWKQGNQMRMAQNPSDALPDADALDAVYRAMCAKMQLLDCHKADLRQRGLSERMIRDMEKKGYKSTQSVDAIDLGRGLIADGFYLGGVPGFFQTEDCGWSAAFYPSNAGYLCPAFDESGRISGFQIRLDVPSRGRKYLWFTSSSLPGGASSRSPASLSGSVNKGIVHVTEGILKAEISYQVTGEPYVGNPGVSNYKGIFQMLAELKEQGLQKIYECYDMDKRLSLACREDYDASCTECTLVTGHLQEVECPKKRQKRDSIRQGCLKLYDICEKLDLKCYRMEWDVAKDGLWNGRYKGIDDWMVRNAKEAFVQSNHS